MKILVTGGCGFIGSHLCEALIKQGHQVRVLDNLSTGKRENLATGAELVEGDIRNVGAVAQCLHDMDACYHLAAVASVQQSTEQWCETHAVNLSGTINIFEQVAKRAKAAGEKPIPVLYASSAAVYGNGAETSLAEDVSLHPLSPYGADKLGCEIQAYVAQHLYGIPNIGFRFFNIYGPRQNPDSPYSGVISIFMKKCRHGQDLTIFGDGEQLRDFVYVDDLVAVLLRALDKIKLDDCRVLNVCTGVSTSINALARHVIDVSGADVVCHHEPARDGDIRVSIGDASRLETALGSVPHTSIKEGLLRYFNSEQNSKP